jgi:small subunit ribosomal protein S8e
MVLSFAKLITPVVMKESNLKNLKSLPLSGWRNVYSSLSVSRLKSEVIAMPLWQGKSKRYHSGARRKSSRKHRKFERGSQATETIMGAKKLRIKRALGKNTKLRLLSATYANVTDKTSGTSEKLRIIQVLQNPSNVDFDRRGIITKGTIIETEKGKALVTSRPGQKGVIDAVKIE